MKEYKTQDIVLSSTLKIHDFELMRIEKIGNKGVFVFKDVSEEFIQDYDLGKVLVNPVEFNNTIRMLTTSVRRMT